MDAAVSGFHHVKLPVADVVRTQAWYCRVLGFKTEIEFVEDGVLMGVALRDPTGTVALALRSAPERTSALAGFDPAFSSRVSLGLLHLGYAMEAAADQRVAVYDFLAGPGQRSDYKRNLSQAHRDLSCVQMVRGRLLPALYRWRDRAR